MHPESVVHSLVEFIDGGVTAQLGLPDMRVPIQYALSYPDRLALSTNRLDLAEIGVLHFQSPDPERFSLRCGSPETLESPGAHTQQF